MGKICHLAVPLNCRYYVKLRHGGKVTGEVDISELNKSRLQS